MDTTRPAELVVSEKNEVTVTVPHVQVIWCNCQRICPNSIEVIVIRANDNFKSPKKYYSLLVKAARGFFNHILPAGQSM